MMIIVTHSGRFHADEVVAYTILNILYPNNKLIRSRDCNIIKLGDIVIDVGGIYDINRKRFDHHQKSFNDVFSDNSRILLSSAGLIYKHFGMPLISILQSEFNKELYDNFYNEFIKEIDIIDNGNYDDIDRTIRTGVSSIIRMMNYSDTNNDEIQMVRFKEASNYALTCMKVIIRSLDKSIRTIDIDMDQISKSFYSRYEYDDKGRILILRQSCPTWICSFKKFRKQIKYNESILFVIFPYGDNWRTGTITIGLHKRRYLECETVLKTLKSFIFEHKNRYLAEFKNIDDAIKAAIISLPSDNIA